MKEQNTDAVVRENKLTLALPSARSRSSLQASVWIAAGSVGLVAVFYAKLVAYLQSIYFFHFNGSPMLVSSISPLLFVLATWVVQKFAPDAKGSGIPQVLAAIEDVKTMKPNQALTSSLVSVRTALVKVLSSAIGILGGASIGREGPTVQIAASGFAKAATHLKKFVPSIDFQSFLVAGAAAGVAAAFNTPLAGIAFALEEIAEGFFGPFRNIVMLAVIVSGITAVMLMGDYLYFGHPALSDPSLMLLPQALALGVIGGLSGGLFAKLLSLTRLKYLGRPGWRRALVCGIVCTGIGLLTHGDTAGSGYEVTRTALMSESISDVHLAFPFLKFTTTVLSYLSGMAGGIFSPSLSIGAGLGLTLAKLAHWQNFKACALIGMVGFFSGVVQAPLTAVVIVMEMTDEHALVLAFLIAAFVAQGLGRWLMPVPLYRFLAVRHLQG